jgi:diguanylate cyclase (GGDEF)-like protein
MIAEITPTTEIIPGYTLLERIGSGGFGEVWKCQAPGGLLKAVKVVFSGDPSGNGGVNCSAQELKAIQHIKAIRHPFLLSVDRYDMVDGRLVIVTELADGSLWDRFRECRANGQLGIPRADLLRFMAEAAEALDVLNTQYHLQHLDVKPQNLLLVHNHIKLADFGLVKGLAGSQGRLAVGLSPLHAAPEVFQGIVSATSDQYSLALVYQEMLTGLRPYASSIIRKQAQPNQGLPDLTPLPPADRPIVARALAKTPENRFSSCGEFVQALQAGGQDRTSVAPAPSGATLAASASNTRPGLVSADAEDTAVEVDVRAIAVPTPDQLVRDLVDQAAPPGAQLQEMGGLRCRLDREGVLQHQCAAMLPEDNAWQKLEGFLAKWQARGCRRTAAGVQAQIPLKTSLWKRLGGAPSTMEISISWRRPVGGGQQVEITARLRVGRAGDPKARALLEQIAPNVLNSLRNYLMAGAEKRAHERFPFTKPMRFAPAGCVDHTLATDCTGHDISMGGVRFHTACPPDGSGIFLFLPVPGAAGTAEGSLPVKARVRQVVPVERGFLVGAQFELAPNAQRRVLLIEDDNDDADRLGALFDEVSGRVWDLRRAEGLESGLEQLAAEGANLVLLDLSLPNVHELEALRQLRLRAPGIPVVVLARMDQQLLAMQAVLEGASDYLIKDRLECDRLARTLHGAVERQRAKHYQDLNKERQRILAELEKGRQKERYLAYHDALTDLPNRTLFYDRLEQSLLEAQRQNTQAAVMFLDLDGFKRINDTLGHSTGDQLLKVVAERLKESVRKTDTVARLGGDEFTIILTNIAGPHAAMRVAEKVLAAVSRPLVMVGQELSVTTSIGVSLFPSDGADVEALVKQADLAMYQAKAQGKNNFQVYHPGLDDAASESLTLETDLRKALEREELVLHYQPQVDLATRVILGVEALVRWQHPERGLLSPAKFIPLAEETGLIVALGEWVMRKACAQNRAWQEAGFAPLRMTVNVSARQFRDKDLAQTVTRILAETGLSPQHLGLEITESCAVQDVEYTIRTLRSLKDIGVLVLIDDFGTGYSSLNHLKLFPIDVLKIEKSFIKGIPNDRGDAAITTAVIGLAHSLGLKVIAEHVETEEQLAFLLGLQCDELQSYLFSRPLPSEGLTQLLVQRRASPCA